MRRSALDTLVSPVSGQPLEVATVTNEVNGCIKEGTIRAADGSATFPITNFVPRFVQDQGYNENFGLQWNRYRQTQLDRYSGTTLSADRLFWGTGWEAGELDGQRILEIGCGAGRFTQVMLDAGAEVFAVDYSSAVDACWTNNAHHPRLTVVQGNIYELPFKKGYFDKVFCYGVLQHTPDVKRSFMSLVPFIRSGGKIAVDCYIVQRWPNRWTSKFLWRPVTRHLPPSLLFKIVNWYVPRWLPIDERVRKIRKLGQLVIGIVPCWNYTDIFPLNETQIREWAVLDTFDALGARYDYPQTVPVVRSWFEEIGLKDISVREGGNGILGNATG